MKILLLLAASVQAIKLSDVSDNQKKLFAAMQRKSGNEIKIFDANFPESYMDDIDEVTIDLLHKVDMNLLHK